ncbi:DUF4192 family protein [Streptomyces sp. NPDC096152]|uniref:DUF4192 domain-containing protein n=1 Tax=Streptomyces sp. NPDC096152 TaxID=3366078 RepID=UPI0038188A83
MTNHSETTGSPESGDFGTGAYGAGEYGKGLSGEGVSGDHRHGGDAQGDPEPGGGDIAYDTFAGPESGQEGPEHQVTLRTPAELADALPYLLGYRPEDSIVLVALHDRDGRGRFGGRARLGIPPGMDDWPSAARQLAQGLIAGSERRGAKPEQMVAFLCQEPAAGESGRQVMRRLEPLAQKLRTECGRLDVPVIEALCISDGRFWSYCCPSEGCCPDEGLPMGLPGTSVLAAAAAYAGIQVRGSLREMRARLLPWETAAALDQEIALDTAGMDLVPRILDEGSRAAVAEQTLELAERVVRRFAEAPFVPGSTPADLRDDDLLTHQEAAALILGLQDRETRDRAAEWMEGDEAGPALRLWRALARRCVGPYGEHAAVPLTLAGWVAWSTGDDLEAREALAMALGADSDYLFARLLHQACNEGLDPESVRRCLRAERDGRARPKVGGSEIPEARGVPEAEGAVGAVGEETNGAAPREASPTDARETHGAAPHGAAETAAREAGPAAEGDTDTRTPPDGRATSGTCRPPASEVAPSRRRRRTRAGRPDPSRSGREDMRQGGDGRRPSGTRRVARTHPATSRSDTLHLDSSQSAGRPRRGITAGDAAPFRGTTAGDAAPFRGAAAGDRTRRRGTAARNGAPRRGADSPPSPIARGDAPDGTP